MRNKIKTKKIFEFNTVRKMKRIKFIITDKNQKDHLLFLKNKNEKIIIPRITKAPNQR